MRSRLPSAPASLVTAVFLLLGSSPAQENAIPFDAAQVVWDENTCIRHVVDLDGDGKLDALGWWYVDAQRKQFRVRAYRRSMSGAWSLMFQQDETIVNQGQVWPGTPMVVGDFDGDGRTDWAMALGLAIRVYTSSPTGTPVLLATLSESAMVESLVAADFDGDQDSDLAIVTSGTVVVWHNQAGGFVRSTPLAIYPLRSPCELYVGEFDGDGRSDVMLCDPVSLWLLTTQNMTPLMLSKWTHGENDPRPSCGDLDGDGDRDIVVFGAEPATYSILRRTGPATFVAEASRPGGTARFLADVDLDGDLDGICCGGGGGGPGSAPNNRPANFRIAWNDHGVFQPAVLIPGLGSERIAGAVDIDSDGDIDLVAGRCIYYARNGAYAPARPQGTASAVPILQSDLSDLDGDGDLDFGVAFGECLRNPGTGVPTSVVPVFPQAPPGTSFSGQGYAGDFDGDGDPDLVVCHVSGTTVLGMRLLQNRGGTFFDAGPAGPVSFAPLGSAASQLGTSLATDLDRDGDQDLVVWTGPGISPPHTLIWLNTGRGTFVAGSRIDGVIPQQAIDLDADGNIDLVGTRVLVTNYDGTLAICFGRGDGTFQTELAFGLITVAQHADRLAIFDFDADGDLDVVGGATRFGSNVADLGVLLNQGSRAFAYGPAVPGLGGYSSGRVAFLADVDEDGAKELVATAQGGGIAFAKRQAATWTVFARQVMPVHALADFDGDGDLDVYAGSTVFEGLARSGPGVGHREQFGEGCACAGGVVPTLGAIGPFRSGSTVGYRASGITGGSLGILGCSGVRVDLVDVPFAGMVLFPRPDVVVPLQVLGRLGAHGEGTANLDLPIPDLPSLPLHHQAFFLDPASPHSLGVTQGLTLVFGPSAK